jgi:hypothetical protein
VIRRQQPASDGENPAITDSNCMLLLQVCESFSSDEEQSVRLVGVCYTQKRRQSSIPPNAVSLGDPGPVDGPYDSYDALEPEKVRSSVDGSNESDRFSAPPSSPEHPVDGDACNTFDDGRETVTLPEDSAACDRCVTPASIKADDGAIGADLPWAVSEDIRFEPSGPESCAAPLCSNDADERLKKGLCLTCYQTLLRANFAAWQVAHNKS